MIGRTKTITPLAMMVKPKFFKSPFMAVPQRNYLIDSRLGSNTNNFLMLDEENY